MDYQTPSSRISLSRSPTLLDLNSALSFRFGLLPKIGTFQAAYGLLLIWPYRPSFFCRLISKVLFSYDFVRLCVSVLSYRKELVNKIKLEKRSGRENERNSDFNRNHIKGERKYYRQLGKLQN